jgi:crossover junction endodeoxyribonuclease RuvC
MLILGFDPGLGCTGWGVIRTEGSRLAHVADGQVRTDATMPLARRLHLLHGALVEIVRTHRPDGAAVEEVLGNANPQSTLKLGQARGMALLAAAQGGLVVGEYHPVTVKKAVVGTGGAAKTQVQAMVARLLPGARPSGADAADALAVAICHAHHGASALALLKRA